MTDNFLQIYIISDSTGETAETYINSVTTHFPKTKMDIIRKPNTDTKEKIDMIVEAIPKKSSIIVQTVADKSLAEYLNQKAFYEDIKILDILSPAIDWFEEVTGQKALRVEKLTRKLSKDYFSMIDAVEFAVKYDDGRDARGLVHADIVLLGVSRTSKTPLSMLLATKDYKVANLPLVPEIKLPQEIYEVDPKRIIGLIIDPEKLSDIREERSRNLGLDSHAEYFDKNRIYKELEYAKEIFDELECKVIDVSSNTIEETATDIMNYYKENF
ncbi:MAG: pyruvate, water dikinase regulatory protein [Anaerococcus sp.]|jgi:regulator of PEP synthase PpsR (kinase-PPPase family)|nr:kinase/pyrophosphorylase [Peptoniphilaceae bacterium]MDY3054432.1 pyruvate, water dikinase regulatory protein [Anaerococcus sp.]